MKIFLVLFSILLFSSSYAQEEISIDYYKRSRDFSLRKEGPDNIRAIVSEKNRDYIIVKKFIDAETGKKKKKHLSCWAFKYKDEYYFNLRYLGNSRLQGKFIKLDFIRDKFCFAHLEDETIAEFKSNKATLVWLSNLGASLVGTGLSVLDSAISSKHSNWITENGLSKKIIFVNFTKENYNEKGPYDSLRAININKKQIAKMTGDKYKKAEWKKFSFEFAIETIMATDKN